MFDITHTHTHIVSESQDFPPQLSWSDIVPFLMKDPLSAIPSSSSLSVSSAHSRYGEKKEESHFFHFCPRFSAVSTTTVAENIPQKDSANGVGCCLGGCIIGVSGASSLRLCILDAYACMWVGRWGGGALACTRMHACTHAFVPTCICAWWRVDERCGILLVCQRKLHSFHERDGVWDEKGKWLPGNF